MKITKQQLVAIIKEEISEVSRGFRDITPEPKRSDFQPASSKVHTAMTRGQEYAARADSESEGKNFSVNTPDGTRIWLGKDVLKDYNSNPDIPDDLSGQLVVFSILGKSGDKQVGILTIENGKAVAYEEKAGKKYTTVMGSDDDEDGEDDLDEVNMPSTLPTSSTTLPVHENKTTFTKKYILQIINEEIKKVLKK